MISYLKGILTTKSPPSLIVENNGMGYTIEASMQTFYQLPELGEPVLLYTLLFIKEDTQWLYGFINPDERTLFKELIKVNTIGPKAALAILSSMDVLHLYQVVTNQDVRSLQSIPGIGKKTAERLLLELSNRLTHWEPATLNSTTHTRGKDVSKTDYAMQQDAIDALITLGYKSAVATKVIHSIKQQSANTTEELIRLSLNELRKS